MVVLKRTFIAISLRTIQRKHFEILIAVNNTSLYALDCGIECEAVPFIVVFCFLSILPSLAANVSFNKLITASFQIINYRLKPSASLNSTPEVWPKLHRGINSEEENISINPRILRNPKLRYYFDKILQLVSRSWATSIELHFFPSFFLKVHFNITFPFVLMTYIVSFLQTLHTQ